MSEERMRAKELRYDVEAEHAPAGSVELVPRFLPSELSSDQRAIHDGLYGSWGTPGGTVQFDPPLANYFEVGETLDEDALAERFSRAFADFRAKLTGVVRSALPGVGAAAGAVAEALRATFLRPPTVRRKR